MNILAKQNETCNIYDEKPHGVEAVNKWWSLILTAEDAKITKDWRTLRRYVYGLEDMGHFRHAEYLKELFPGDFHCPHCWGYGAEVDCPECGFVDTYAHEE